MVASVLALMAQVDALALAIEWILHPSQEAAKRRMWREVTQAVSLRTDGAVQAHMYM